MSTNLIEPVPIEVHPFGRTLFGRKLIDLEAKVVDCNQEHWIKASHSLPKMGTLFLMLASNPLHQ